MGRVEGGHGRIDQGVAVVRAALAVGLAATLDIAEPGDKIFVVSYGSGSGSDAFIFTVQDAILDKREGPKLSSFIDRKKYVDYATYLKHRGQIIQ